MRINFKNVLKKVGLTKRNLQKITPVISAINPVAGVAATVATGGGARDIFQSVASAALGKIFSGQTGQSIFSAQGRIPGMKEAMANILRRPERFVQNTILAGGDVKRGLIATLASQGLGDVGGIIGNILGGADTFIDLGKFGLSDIAGIASVVNYIKEKPPEPPSAPTFRSLDPETINKLYASYKDVIDQQTVEALDRANRLFNRRGLLRSGLLATERGKIESEAARGLARYKTNLEAQAIKEQQQLAQQQFQNLLKINALERESQARKQEALGELAGRYLENKGINLFGGGASPATDIFSQALSNARTEIAPTPAPTPSPASAPVPHGGPYKPPTKEEIAAQQGSPFLGFVEMLDRMNSGGSILPRASTSGNDRRIPGRTMRPNGIPTNWKVSGFGRR